MKDKKKLIILSSIILGVLVLTLGLTYAAFTYNKTGETSELVLGDIWMKYTENNQLTLADAMPMNINNYTTYKVNPVMATQEVNELYVCATYLIGTFADENLDSGSTLATYCQGTGTEGDGYTFQDDLNDDVFNDEQITFLEDNNIIILEEDGSYTVNPIMATQEVTDNELSRCVNFYQGYEFDEESTVESFCKGTGTAFGGLTIQETLDNWIADAEEYDFDFLEDGGQELLDAGVILPKIENLPYFEFTISGKNTYTKEDIWYDIVLTHGDEHETRTTRIRDNLLRFALSKVEGEFETILLNNKSYSDLNNKRIWVETINANTTSVVNNTYRLYMWISEDTVIGNVGEDYTIEEWNDVYASIKVGVTGDFVEKIIPTDENCFNAVKRIGNFTLNTTEEAVSKCIDYVSSIKRDENFSSENTIEDYCRGNGVRKNYYTNYYTGDFTIKEDILFDTKNASRVTQPFFNSTHIQYFIDEHIIEDVEYVVQLISYDNTCGPNVIIPKEIAGYPVTML
ncbi:MAG: hypothetical protein IJO27_01675, partial [Bacilli bacterium]|nr:hypothetical protein [Bacilli bacterium]